VQVNLNDGRTEHGPPDKRRADQVRGVQIGVDAHQVAISAPKSFKIIMWSSENRFGVDGEVIAEQLDVQADNVRLTVIAFRSGVVRVDLRKTGTPRYLPRKNEENP